MTVPADITYASYLRVKDLLRLQQPVSSPAIHDEMHFIVVHQAFELWFKLALHEADTIAASLREGRLHEAAHLFKRINAIVRLFQPMVTVIETMTPSDFLKFRDLLKPASGFQSFQFRELEFLSGVRDERYVKMFDDDPESQERLRRRLQEPTLWDHFLETLRRRGLDVKDEASQRAAVLRIYREDALADLRALCELMIEYDELFSLWREHHVRMAERMIGRKPGTGLKTVEYSFGATRSFGTQGVEYLATTVTKRFFPLLWQARTEL